MTMVGRANVLSGASQLAIQHFPFWVQHLRSWNEGHAEGSPCFYARGMMIYIWITSLGNGVSMLMRAVVAVWPSSTRHSDDVSCTPGGYVFALQSSCRALSHAHFTRRCRPSLPRVVNHGICEVMGVERCDWPLPSNIFSGLGVPLQLRNCILSPGLETAAINMVWSECNVLQHARAGQISAETRSARRPVHLKLVWRICRHCRGETS
ncbi:hypothetical protein P280DRAFT_335374 [Massarina eburnea CBS 473.64]|uniref:Uncharacterized protein n=1 Tax=Massarina eburnea CBS 473.64 TaxID=1395130 RepID=A0A6A6RGI8_9PLEO|nr:hypothetical protein P280DRAFT_335374 [Massarina eburnea CBS 473.64]